jgi:hypothetical protein
MLLQSAANRRAERVREAQGGKAFLGWREMDAKACRIPETFFPQAIRPE